VEALTLLSPGACPPAYTHSPLAHTRTLARQPFRYSLTTMNTQRGIRHTCPASASRLPLSDQPGRPRSHLDSTHRASDGRCPPLADRVGQSPPPWGRLAGGRRPAHPTRMVASGRTDPMFGGRGFAAMGLRRFFHLVTCLAFQTHAQAPPSKGNPFQVFFLLTKRSRAEGSDG